MKLELCKEVTRCEYLETKDFYFLRDKVYKFLVNEQGKSHSIADAYINYSYKSYDSLKFVNMILIELDNKPYFINEVFFNEDGSRIFAQGTYAGKKYNFELV